MPSDPAGVHPQGTLVRPASDFFDDNLAVAAFSTILFSPPAGLHYFTIALFNDANTGVVFKVYGVTAASDGGSGLTLFFVKGPIGARQQSASAIRPDVGSPFGQIYFQSTTVAAGTPNPFITGPILAQIGAGGFDSGTSLSPFPLFIIPAGYSLVATNVGSYGNAGATFWYQTANE